MSVYINGMEVPKRGHTVTLTITGGGEAVVQYYDCKPQLAVPIVYKAVPVPEHGDLISRKELCEKLEKAIKIKPHLEAAFNAAISLTLVAPTIIPAIKMGEEVDDP